MRWSYHRRRHHHHHELRSQLIANIFQINKEISAFLARNRARNDASNRTEFLLSLSEKRKRQESGNGPEDGTIPSCARTDAKTIDREAQMKYDIAKNDNGPLSRTKARKSNSRQPEPQTTSDGRARDPTVVPSDENALPRHHPGVDERLTDIETHLAVRYGQYLVLFIF